MTFTINDALKIVNDFVCFSDGNSEEWINTVWKIIKKQKLNVCNSDLDLFNFYSILCGLCKIYSHFCDLIFETSFEDDCDLEIDYTAFEIFNTYYDEDNDYEDDDTIKCIISSIIYDSNNIYRAFKLLETTMNCSETFAKLYYCLNYEQFTLEDYETDEYYYGDITDPDELDEAKYYYEDYETRKIYATDEDAMLDEILNNVSSNKVSAFDWISEYME